LKIGVFSTNLNFCGAILEELRAHHTVKVFKSTKDDSLDYANLIGLLNWCDVAYFDFIQYPLPWATNLQYLDKPIVARMLGIDILNYANINWTKISALILGSTQEKQLLRLRRIHQKRSPKKKLPLPPLILKCYTGIDLGRFKLDAKRKPGFNIILHSNVIRQTKGIYTALQCFGELIERDGDNPWHLTLIAQAEGWNWSRRQEYVMCVQELLEELNFSSKRFKHYNGNLSKKDWTIYLQSQDIYWCLSRRESFGASMAEACASGTYPLLNHFYGAERLYPQANLCRSPGELVDKTIRWGRLSNDEKLHARRLIRKHVEQYDQLETAKKVRNLIEACAKV
jgi:glycosyltransferase involved in cell wall biosynthesis